MSEHEADPRPKHVVEPESQPGSTTEELVKLCAPLPPLGPAAQGQGQYVAWAKRSEGAFGFVWMVTGIWPELRDSSGKPHSVAIAKSTKLAEVSDADTDTAKSQRETADAELKALAAEHQVRIVNFGHAGNGNIHVNLLGNPDDPAELARMHRCLDAVFDLVLKLEGTISGEHGVGMAKRPFVGREIDAITLELMRQIKRLFDPAGILNPGKTLPD